MNELTIIKVDSGAYIDSREVADFIGKRHDNLLRDIDGYLRILGKFNTLNFEGIDFFLKSSYIDARGREKPCYLMTKKGCELCANKLTGERGVLFTAAYVTRFNDMEAAERAAEIKSHARPRLSEFNSAVRNVLTGMSYNHTVPGRVMSFLRGVYEPLGIEVQTEGDNTYYLTATQIAWLHGVYSESGKPHVLAVAAIISKLENQARHAIVVPYGLVGISVRYDSYIVDAV
jgi:Rha family phage regulatory protein